MRRNLVLISAIFSRVEKKTKSSDASPKAKQGTKHVPKSSDKNDFPQLK